MALQLPIRIPGLTTTRVAGHTAPMIDDGRLPGGIGVARAWWLVRRPRRVRVGMIAAVLFYGFYVVYFLAFLGREGAIPLAVGVVALVVLIPITFRDEAPGVLVTRIASRPCMTWSRRRPGGSGSQCRPRSG